MKISLTSLSALFLGQHHTAGESVSTPIRFVTTVGDRVRALQIIKTLSFTRDTLSFAEGLRSPVVKPSCGCKTSQNADFLVIHCVNQGLLCLACKQVAPGLKSEANVEVLSTWPAGGDSTGSKKKSDCMEVYEKMTLLLTLFITPVHILNVQEYLNEFMVAISSFNSSSIQHDSFCKIWSHLK